LWSNTKPRLAVLNERDVITTVDQICCLQNKCVNCYADSRCSPDPGRKMKISINTLYIKIWHRELSVDYWLVGWPSFIKPKFGKSSRAVLFSIYFSAFFGVARQYLSKKQRLLRNDRRAIENCVERACAVRYNFPQSPLVSFACAVWNVMCKMESTTTDVHHDRHVLKQPTKVLLTLSNVLLPKEKLTSTPSMVDGLDFETEVDLRIVGCEWIQTAGILLKLPQVSRWYLIYVHMGRHYLFLLIYQSR